MTREGSARQAARRRAVNRTGFAHFCPECGSWRPKRFQTLYGLRMHVQTQHTGERGRWGRIVAQLRHCMVRRW